MRNAIFAFLIAFAVSLASGKLLLPFLHKLKFGQQVRSDGPKTHLAKQGTPTMGGMIFYAGAIAALLLLCTTFNGAWVFITISLVLTLGFGLLGFLDDYIKIVKKRSLGLRAYQKLIGQFGLAVIVAVWAYREQLIGSALIIPWLNVSLELGWLYIPFTVLVIVGTVNAVNLMDGLDGLAGSAMFLDSIAFCVISGILGFAAAAAGDVMLGAELSSMTVFCGALSGGILAFLCYNRYPAHVFMGDTGSMGLGGALAAMGVVTRGQLLIPVIGVMFVVTAVSVILQVGSYKLRNKKRIFLMAPIHHHFELKGYSETSIVSAYSLITAIACVLLLLGFTN